MAQDAILELIKDYYSCWTGRDSNGRHCGISSNPKAARRSEKLYRLFGDKWGRFSDRVNDRLIELEEKWFDDNPKYEKYRSTGYGIGKVANETWPEAEKIIEAEFRKTFGNETIKSLNENYLDHVIHDRSEWTERKPPKFKVGDRVCYKDRPEKVGTVKRVVGYLPGDDEACYQVSGFETETPDGTLPSLEGENMLDYADDGEDSIKKISENSKVTLTIGQLKKLVRESSDTSMNYGLAGVCNKLQILGNSMRELYESWKKAVDSNETKRAQACLREMKRKIDSLPEMLDTVVNKFNEVTKDVDFGRPALPDDA